MKSGIVLIGLLFLMILATPQAYGEEYTFKYGKSAPGSPRSSKVFGLGYQDSLSWGWRLGYQADLLSTPSNPNSISIVTGPQLGLGVDGEHAFVRSMWGPAYLSQTDQELGGHLQFMQDFTVGVQDQYALVGLGYKHISSAGLAKPNRGKDFLYVTIGTKF